MSATIREFLETYPLYKKFSIETMPTLGWRGDWPEVVSACCPVCRANRAFRMWPSKLTGFTPGWAGPPRGDRGRGEPGRGVDRLELT
jgi:hypothetical protein